MDALYLRTDAITEEAEQALAKACGRQYPPIIIRDSRGTRVVIPANALTKQTPYSGGEETGTYLILRTNDVLALRNMPGGDTIELMIKAGEEERAIPEEEQ